MSKRPTMHRTKSGFYRNDEHCVSNVVYRSPLLRAVEMGLMRMFGDAPPPDVPEDAPVAPMKAPVMLTHKPVSQGVKQALRRTQSR